MGLMWVIHFVALVVGISVASADDHRLRLNAYFQPHSCNSALTDFKIYGRRSLLRDLTFRRAIEASGIRSNLYPPERVALWDEYLRFPSVFRNLFKPEFEGPPPEEHYFYFKDDRTLFKFQLEEQSLAIKDLILHHEFQAEDPVFGSLRVRAKLELKNRFDALAIDEDEFDAEFDDFLRESLRFDVLKGLRNKNQIRRRDDGLGLATYSFGENGYLQKLTISFESPYLIKVLDIDFADLQLTRAELNYQVLLRADRKEKSNMKAKQVLSNKEARFYEVEISDGVFSHKKEMHKTSAGGDSVREALSFEINPDLIQKAIDPKIRFVMRNFPRPDYLIFGGKKYPALFSKGLLILRDRLEKWHYAGTYSAWRPELEEDGPMVVPFDIDLKTSDESSIDLLKVSLDLKSFD